VRYVRDSSIDRGAAPVLGFASPPRGLATREASPVVAGPARRGEPPARYAARAEFGMLGRRRHPSFGAEVGRRPAETAKAPGGAQCTFPFAIVAIDKNPALGECVRRKG